MLRHGIACVLGVLLLIVGIPASADTVKIAAAGDIASTNTNDTKTSDEVLALDPALVLALGDNAYENGTIEEYNTLYDPTWGRFKDRTFPAVGNHEYNVSTVAQGYIDYFGVPTGMRSQVVGDWLIVSLNSQKNLKGEALQLRDLLASDTHECELLFWHRPRWSSGFHGPIAGMQPLWSAATDFGVDVVLNGHDHLYERFAPMDTTGAVVTQGTREFIVGTGGKQQSAIKTASLPSSQARVGKTSGVLSMDLNLDSYGWEYRSATGGTGTVLDSGSTACH